MTRFSPMRRSAAIPGAPRLVFAASPPESLRPALEAHAKKDYSGCEALGQELMASGKLPAGDRPAADRLLKAVQFLRESNAHTFTHDGGRNQRGRPLRGRDGATCLP